MDNVTFQITMTQQEWTALSALLIKYGLENAALAGVITEIFMQVEHGEGK